MERTAGKGTEVPVVPDAAARRLEALARVVGAPARGGGLDGLLVTFAEGVLFGFGLEAAVNLLDEDLDAYVIRAVVGGGAEEMMGARIPSSVMEELLEQRFEVIPDVYFVPHEAGVDWSRLGEAVYTASVGWKGPGYWHAEDACLVRLRSSQGKDIGLVGVHSPTDQRVPDQETFEMLRLFALVGANAIENLQLQRQLAALEAEREMEVLRRDLFRSVSHELRTPLTSIRGLAHLAAKPELPDAQRLEFVDIIAKQSEHLTAILNDLLMAERAAAGRLPVSAQPVDVDAAVDEAIHVAGLTADARVRVSKSGVTALADPRRVTQAVANLLANAATYAPDGLIHVQAWQDGRWVLIEVEDDGPGIPTEELDAVFSRFQRGSTSLETPEGGSGLGLYVTKQLVEAMGGHIGCRSQPGIGTRFTIELPVAT